MFIGHFALGFAAKRVLPRASLATLIAAAQLADLIWPPLVALGLERVVIVPADNALLTLRFLSYPYSHSLLALVLWGVAYGVIAGRRTRDNVAIGVVATLVVSHWVLDFVTHRPDMPLYPGGPKVGLGLWNHPIATIAVESAMFAVGILIYR